MILIISANELQDLVTVPFGNLHYQDLQWPSNGHSFLPSLGIVKKKRGSIPHLGLEPYPTTMSFDNLFGYRKSNACSFILLSRVQSLEQNEHFILVSWVYTYAVVLDRE